jgi:hypothetical protein
VRSNYNRNPLVGTWQLKSYVVITDAGEKTTPYGEHPIGYLNYSEDGRMQVIGTSSGRLVPHDPTPTDQEHVSLYKTMFAYAGTYWNGTDQARFYEVNGRTLTITTRAMNPESDTEAQYVLVWEKVTSHVLL